MKNAGKYSAAILPLLAGAGLAMAAGPVIDRVEEPAGGYMEWPDVRMQNGHMMGRGPMHRRQFHAYVHGRDVPPDEVAQLGSAQRHWEWMHRRSPGPDATPTTDN